MASSASNQQSSVFVDAAGDLPNREGATLFSGANAKVTACSQHRAAISECDVACPDLIDHSERREVRCWLAGG
jgi:hypothetical protein